MSQAGFLGVVCSFDAQKFPFDKQKCVAVLQIGTYLANEVDLVFSSYGAQYIGGQISENPIWSVGRLQYTKSITTIGLALPTGALTIGFGMTRKSLYYTCTMIVPSALLSILTLGAFFIPNDSGEKISCGLSIFLSFVVFLIQIGEIVPENSTAISVIGKRIICFYGLLLKPASFCLNVFYFRLKRNTSCSPR